VAVLVTWMSFASDHRLIHRVITEILLVHYRRCSLSPKTALL
jgi:hypothetical protein